MTAEHSSTIVNSCMVVCVVCHQQQFWQCHHKWCRCWRPAISRNKKTDGRVTRNGGEKHVNFWAGRRQNRVGWFSAASACTRILTLFSLLSFYSNLLQQNSLCRSKKAAEAFPYLEKVSGLPPPTDAEDTPLIQLH